MTSSHNIDPQTLQLWQNKGHIYILDVREPGEFRSQSIPGAKNLPLSQISKTDFELPTHLPIAIYCQSGMRSQKALSLLQTRYPQAKLSHLSGGIVAWKKAGFPVEKSGSAMLPLNRQVQVLLGVFILLGTALGYFFQPSWLLIPVMIGLGLLNAGITGWCGMAILMAKMPWNRA